MLSISGMEIKFKSSTLEAMKFDQQITIPKDDGN